jgi:hypothetical protein
MMCSTAHPSLDSRLGSLLPKHFLRRRHRVAVNPYRVIHLLRVTSRLSHHGRNIARPRNLKHQLIAALEPFDRQIQPA